MQFTLNHEEITRKIIDADFSIELPNDEEIDIRKHAHEDTRTGEYTTDWEYSSQEDDNKVQDWIKSLPEDDQDDAQMELEDFIHDLSLFKDNQ